MNRILSYVLAATVLVTPLYAASTDAKVSGEKKLSKEERMEKRVAYFEKELALTPDQSAKVKAIREKYKGQMKERRETIKAAKKDLKESMKSDKKGPEAQKELNAKFQKIQALKQENSQQMFAMALEIREVLTPAQVQKFHELREKHKGEKGKHGRCGFKKADSKE
jgi:Spy/CpxP family protein refolding chaperone